MAAELPSGRIGQVLALGLAGIVLGAIWLGVVRPLRVWYGERANLVTARQALALDLEKRAASVPALLRQAQEERVGERARTALLMGASDAVAGAYLLEHLQRLARDSGTILTNLALVPAVPMGAYRRVGVEAALTATWPEFMRLLHAIDVSSPSVLVDAVEIRATPFVTRDSEQPLDVDLTVFAFRADRPLPRQATAR